MPDAPDGSPWRPAPAGNRPLRRRRPGPARLRRGDHRPYRARGRWTRDTASSTLVRDDPLPIAGSLDTTVAEIVALGRTALAVPMDLMDRSSVENVAAVALADMGRVDVLVNNAIYQGPGHDGPHSGPAPRLAERCLVGDYLHPLLLTQLLLPGMLEFGEPRPLNMLSEAAFASATSPDRRRTGGAWPTPRPRRPSTA